MQRKKRVGTLLLSLLVAGTLGFSTLPQSVAGDTTVLDEETGISYNTQDDWLHVEGNKIVDSSGNEVWLTGCNWFGYNVGSQVFDGVWSQNMHAMLEQIADHGFNVIRVPMSVQILAQWRDGGADPQDTPKVNTYSNPELSVTGVEGGKPLYSFEIWNYAVKWCRQLGVKIFIDIHSASTDSAGHQWNMWYNDSYSAEDMRDALCWFAEYYKNDDTIIGIDLKNEPHGTINEGDFAKWDGSTDPNNWRYAASWMGSDVLDVNPNLLILVEGIECYPKFEEGNDWNSPEIDYTRNMYMYYHNTWWGACLRGAKDFPVDFGSAKKNQQLLYSVHDYGPLVWKQTWFDKDFTMDTLLEDCWYDNWAYLLEDHPMLIGEWGGFVDDKNDADGTNRKWMTALRDYMIQNRVSHTFWCFNENSGDTGGLVYDNFGKWDEVKYAMVEPALWKDRKDVFVGLDHAVALGANGQSLNQYYGSNPSTSDTVSTTISTSTSVIDGLLAGDVDCSGVVDIGDVILLNRYISEDTTINITKTGLQNADTDQNQNVNSTDVVNILKYIAKLTTSVNPTK